MQTLAQAHKLMGGEIPPRRSDMPMDLPVYQSQLIFNLAGLCYITHPTYQDIPNGFEFFCTLDEYLNFAPAKKLIEGNAYQFNCSPFERVIIGVFSKNDGVFYDSRRNSYELKNCTNIKLLTVSEGDK